ncbi:MAG: YbjP/YqhG family protein [Verrucomicrobiota bacterium]|nr:YbjP/YqhG family protein [Verrucomicrobiota bacterium]
MSISRLALLASILMMLPSAVRATSNYHYGPDEYVTVSNGISPDGKFAITAHGNGSLGYGEFHLYLTDAIRGNRLGSLEEVKQTLDTGAGAFAAQWSPDSQQATIVYRVDRHAPLKAVSYRISGQRARCVKGPFDVKSENLIKYWQAHGSHSSPSPKVFGTPLPPAPPAASTVETRTGSAPGNDDARKITERVNTFFKTYQTRQYRAVERELRAEYLTKRYQGERAEEDKHPENMDGDPYTLADAAAPWEVGVIEVKAVEFQGARAEASVTRAGEDHGMKVSLVKETGKWLIDKISFARR